jgi:hypothetical protein
LCYCPVNLARIVEGIGNVLVGDEESSSSRSSANLSFRFAKPAEESQETRLRDARSRNSDLARSLYEIPIRPSKNPNRKRNLIEKDDKETKDFGFRGQFAQTFC